MVPEAEILFYGGPNTSDTTLLYTFDAAVGDARAQVLSDSFAHAEATTPIATAHTYDESALIAAALGITIVSAAGDSNQVDVPADSPYVTAVGGTNVDLNPDGSWLHEQSWELGGCGLSKIFPQPAWQLGAYGAAKGQRAVADVSIAVGPSWVKFLSNWTYADGTSGSTPVFAAILTLVNQSRKVVGKPSVGFINPIIYQHQATRAAFHDIIDRGSGGCATTVGYDLATGIGSPKAAELAAAMP
jgi:kumamolisin